MGNVRDWQQFTLLRLFGVFGCIWSPHGPVWWLRMIWVPPPVFQLLALIAHMTIWETRNRACLQRPCVIDNPFISRDRWTCWSLRLFLLSHYWQQVSCLIPQPSRGDGTTSVLCLYVRTYQMASSIKKREITRVIYESVSEISIHLGKKKFPKQLRG